MDKKVRLALQHSADLKIMRTHEIRETTYLWFLGSDVTNFIIDKYLRRCEHCNRYSSATVGARTCYACNYNICAYCNVAKLKGTLATLGPLHKGCTALFAACVCGTVEFKSYMFRLHGSYKVGQRCMRTFVPRWHAPNHWPCQKKMLDHMYNARVNTNIKDLKLEIYIAYRNTISSHKSAACIDEPNNMIFGNLPKLISQGDYDEALLRGKPIDMINVS